ncbi:MAG: hypothetical protein WBM50_21250 [Acidimicrobiales bacterium]
MAEIVLGVGSSHSPMVSMQGPDWLAWGRHGDPQHPMLYTETGDHVTYDEQLADVNGSFDDRITDAVVSAGATRVHAAVDRLHQAIVDAHLDAIIIVGDDQDEHLFADNLPPFLLYWGDTIANAGMDSLGPDTPEVVRRFMPGYHEDGPGRDYPVDVALARHLIDHLLDHDFDIASSNQLPNDDRRMGHAFAFPLRRLARAPIPVVPVMVNTYNPPAQPRAGRCLHFGRAIGEAIRAFPTDARVGVIASGGLSHFLVLEDLDRRVLAALERGDLDELCAIPEETFVAGTSEIKNWIVAAGACEARAFETVDYVPGYRTPAGTGTGLGFAMWQ